MPAIVEDLGASQSQVQLTLSAFFFAMGIGQLVIGPVSDVIGRKNLLLAGAVLALAASVLAALAPSIIVLIIARALQGLGGGACVVLARAVVPDLLEGPAAARCFSMLMAVQSIAPALAPILGGVLAGPLGWRGIYWVLAGLHLIQLILSAWLVPETAGKARRPAPGAAAPSAAPDAAPGTSAAAPAVPAAAPGDGKLAGGKPAGGASRRRWGELFREVLGNYLAVLRSGRIWAFIITMSFGFAAMFCYISASPFVLQEQFGFSAIDYSLVFAVNALGLFGMSTLNSRLIGRFTPAQMLVRGIIFGVVANLALLAVVFAGLPVPAVLIALFFCVGPTALIMGNSTALATALMRRRAGSVSAVLGFSQSLVAGTVSPLMGLGGDPLRVMAIGMTVCIVVSAVAVGIATRDYPVPAER